MCSDIVKTGDIVSEIIKDHHSYTLTVFLSPSSLRRNPLGPSCRSMYMVVSVSIAWDWCQQQASLDVLLHCTLRGIMEYSTWENYIHFMVTRIMYKPPDSTGAVLNVLGQGLPVVSVFDQNIALSHIVVFRMTEQFRKCIRCSKINAPTLVVYKDTRYTVFCNMF